MFYFFYYLIGPCCSSHCKFITLASKKTCSVTCFYQSFCNGKSAQCPVDSPIPAGHQISATCTCDGYGNCIMAFSLIQKINQPIVISSIAAASIFIFAMILYHFTLRSKINFQKDQKKTFRVKPFVYKRLK